MTKIADPGRQRPHQPRCGKGFSRRRLRGYGGDPQRQAARELAGARPVKADALDRESLIKATAGVDLVFNGLSPHYTEWSNVLPMAENVVAACRANGAAHIVSRQRSTIIGSPSPEVIAEDAPQAPDPPRRRDPRRHGRAVPRARPRAGGVRTIVLRAGDFFGGARQRRLARPDHPSKLAKSIFTAGRAGRHSA